MSDIARANVWRDCEQRGIKLLIMIALADEVNTAGETSFCHRELAAKVNAKPETVSAYLRQLAGAGEIEYEPGCGVGSKSRIWMHRYGERLAAPEQVAANPVNPVSASGDSNPVNPVNPAPTYDLYGVSVAPAAPVAVPPTRDVLSPPPLTQSPGPNGSGSNDPSPSRRQRAAGTRRAATPPDPRVKALTEALAEWQGYTACNWAAEGAAAKRIIAAGYTVDDARTVWRRMKGEAFWADKHLPLASVFTQLGAKLGGPNGRKRDVIVLEPIRRGGVS